MDSIFDEDVDEVGGEIEAYCPSSRCKADTTHTIISMYEDEVRRVQCVVCGEIHAYRKPRGEVYDEPIDPPTMVRKKLARKPTWEEAMAQVTEHDLANCRPYSIRDTYQELDIVSHPTFDVGFVTELLPDNKVEITFKDEQRILVHNRGDLADKMPALSNAPAPREQQRRRKRKTRAVSPLVQQFRPSGAEKISSEDTSIGINDDELDDSGADDPIKMAVEQIRAKRQQQAADPEALKQAQVAAAEAKAELAKRAAAKKIGHDDPEGSSRKKRKKDAFQHKDAEMAASPTAGAEFYSEADQAYETIGLAASAEEHEGSRQVTGAAADVSSDVELRSDAADPSSLRPAAQNGHALRGKASRPPAEEAGLDGVADESMVLPESAPEPIPSATAESEVARFSMDLVTREKRPREADDTSEISASGSEVAVEKSDASKEHREGALVIDALDSRGSSVMASAPPAGTPDEPAVTASKGENKGKLGAVPRSKRSLEEKAPSQGASPRLEKPDTKKAAVKRQAVQADTPVKKIKGDKAATTKKAAAKKPIARKAAAKANVAAAPKAAAKPAARKSTPAKKSTVTPRATVAKKAAAMKPAAKKAAATSKAAAVKKPAAAQRPAAKKATLTPRATVAKKAAAMKPAAKRVVPKSTAAAAKKAAATKPAAKKVAPKSTAIRARKPAATKMPALKKTPAPQKPSAKDKAVAARKSANPKSTPKKAAAKKPAATAKKPALNGKKAATPKTAATASSRGKAAAAKKPAARNNSTRAAAKAKVASRHSSGSVPVRSKPAPAKKKPAPPKKKIKATGRSRQR